MILSLLAGLLATAATAAATSFPRAKPFEDWNFVCEGSPPSTHPLQLHGVGRTECVLESNHAFTRPSP